MYVVVHCRLLISSFLCLSIQTGVGSLKYICFRRNQSLIQFDIYLNHPIRSDGALTEVLLWESIRVGEDVLDSNIYFPPRNKTIKRFEKKKDSHD